MRRAWGLVAAMSLIVAACGSGDGGLRVLAAASLQRALADEGASADAYSFAGSQQLVAQVEAGADADVVVTADERTMARLAEAGLVEAPVIVATTTLALVVQAGNPKGVQALADLARPDVAVVLADPAVPAGRYAADVLARAGVTVRPRSLELDVEAAGQRVALGEADAAVVYATHRAHGTELVRLGAEAGPVVRYPAAVVRASTRKAEGRALIAALPARLQRAGFDAP